MDIIPAGAADRADIEHLLDLSFGTDRHGRTAYRLRDGVDPIPGLSLVARDRGRLVGSIQFWPIELASRGRARPVTLLGPVAAHPDRQGEGVGTALMQASLALADDWGHHAIILIGDPEYYGRFGFSAAPTAKWSVPGPVERHRLLARLTGKTALPAVGDLRPPRTGRLAA